VLYGVAAYNNLRDTCVCVRMCELWSCRTLGRVLLMIAAVWMLSVIVSLPPLFGWKRPQPVVDGYVQCVLSEETGYVIYFTLVNQT